MTGVSHANSSNAFSDSVQIQTVIQIGMSFDQDSDGDIDLDKYVAAYAITLPKGYSREYFTKVYNIDFPFKQG